ncbi:hypothetical protein SAMN04244553_4878 [Nocardia amikacinitolerans]|uniref:Uncharacterized protein n=1 Tax=Nocardia amikacinitolerans TaxID=756689 RepID=A0A285LSP8_9NOCA|nr:hypothetical protein [Nocardia amikacinitolerans]SNY87918.1 hypothetical protein SAMN04244553_4878 [Nocardia amikacinitolerans]
MRTCANDVLFILRYCGVRVPADVAARIAACRDRHTPDTWMRRPWRITAIGQLLG